MWASVVGDFPQKMHAAITPYLSRMPERRVGASAKPPTSILRTVSTYRRGSIWTFTFGGA